MSDFNPTHEFRGLKLEHHGVDGYIDGLGSYYDERGTQYRLSSDVVTKILPQPKPGEVWKFTGPHHEDASPFRGVDPLGRLVTTSHHTVVWDPIDHDDLMLRSYEKIFNADGSPA